MENSTRRPTIDDFTPKTRLQFPDGSILTVGTKRDDDDPLQYGVQLVYDSGATPEPGMNILLPPHSIDFLIPLLENLANQARFIMGQRMVEYPTRPQIRTPKRKKKKAANQASHATSKPAPSASSSAHEG